jgi:hypothetical protein
MKEDTFDGNAIVNSMAITQKQVLARRAGPVGSWISAGSSAISLLCVPASMQLTKKGAARA